MNDIKEKQKEKDKSEEKRREDAEREFRSVAKRKENEGRKK